MLTGTWLPPQYLKLVVLKLRQGTWVPAPREVCLKLVSVLLYTLRKEMRKNIGIFSCINLCFLPTILAGGPPQQGPPPSGLGGMPGPPGAMGAPTRGPPPPRPPLMPPGGMYADSAATSYCGLGKTSCCCSLRTGK